MADTQTMPQPATAPQPATTQQSEPAKPEMGLSALLEQIVDEQTKRMLIEQEAEKHIFRNNWSLAGVFSKSGYFSDAQEQAKAMAKIEIGRSWGLTAADAMRYVYMVNGKPSVENEIVAARLRQAGWDWKPQFIGGAGPQCKGVRLFLERGGKPFMQERRKDEDGSVVLGEDGKPVLDQVCVAFVEADAKLIKVHETGKQVTLLEKKGPWSDGWRANMYYWRAIAQFRRFYANDVMHGVLIPDEAQDIRQEAATAPAIAAIRADIATANNKPRAETITAIREMKSALTADVWTAILRAEDPLDLKTEADARGVLAMMQGALEAKTEAA